MVSRQKYYKESVEIIFNKLLEAYKGNILLLYKHIINLDASNKLKSLLISLYYNFVTNKST